MIGYSCLTRQKKIMTIELAHSGRVLRRNGESHPLKSSYRVRVTVGGSIVRPFLKQPDSHEEDFNISVCPINLLIADRKQLDSKFTS